MKGVTESLSKHASISFLLLPQLVTTNLEAEKN